MIWRKEERVPRPQQLIASSTRAASRTVRVIGPTVTLVGVAGIMPWRLTSGTVGRNPTRFPTDAGPRIEPPVSSPIPIAAKFAATPDPVPPEEPLALRAGAYACLMGPDADPKYPDATSPSVALRITTAPARPSLDTMVASACGTKSLKMIDP